MRTPIRIQSPPVRSLTNHASVIKLSFIAPARRKEHDERASIMRDEQRGKPEAINLEI
jgi:hypothetical protein